MTVYRLPDDGLGPETCSWCTREVPVTSLRETDEGNLCGECYAKFLDAREQAATQ